MSCVYFIQCGKRVKIGVATDVLSRLMSLQIGSPEPLRLRAVIENAGMKQERELHAKFDAQRLRGEWFTLDGDLAAFIATLPAYERDAAPETGVKQFLSANVVRVDRGDRWLTSGVLYKKYSVWCLQNCWPVANKAQALEHFYNWFDDREYTITGGTMGRPRWTAWGAAIAA